MARPVEDVDERFWRYAMPEPNSGCWLWSGASTRDGYGRFQVAYSGHQEQRAHRFSYRRFKGPIPDGLQLDHKCRVRCCVNPDHLEAVTAKVNTLRSEAVSAKNARKTHCVNGHEFVGENLYLTPDKKYRVCTQCIREWKRRWRAKNRKPRPVITHCQKGHDYTADNTIISSRGYKVCKICQRSHQSEWKIRNRGHS